MDQHQTAKFRSVLPHEPLPQEELGYLHIQGAFQPKPATGKKDTVENQETFQWTSFQELQEALLQSLFSHGVQSVSVLDSSFTKIRLVFESPAVARQIMWEWKQRKLSPSHLFPHYKMSHRPLQITQVTTTSLPDIAWPRSNPPKFRRLLSTAQAESNEKLLHLQQARSTTRFVYCNGLFENNEGIQLHNYEFVDAIRNKMNQFDSSGLGVEVFYARKKHSRHCHLGMRSNRDARNVIGALQGKVVQWQVGMSSAALFLDYAEVMCSNTEKDGTGEPSRSECTSTTSNVQVPGLVLVENFVSQPQEEALLAVLLGPHAPWAPSQITPSNGVVKRRVQHYGYVFDYQTANVLRDRSNENANCPPLPGMDINSDDTVSEPQLKEFIDTSTAQGKGWHVLAGMLERIRRHEFVTTEQSSAMFPHINQMTVNEYVPGQGIGSHVDTPSAFGDGLLSLSLGGGVVMELKCVKQKKLVYLPSRSLLCLSGPARYEWEHMIASRRTDTHNGVVLPRSLRVSLTLRTALQLDGSIPMPRVESNTFPPKWGNATSSDSTSKCAFATPDTEREHVHNVYNAIATQWHHTRGKRGVLWPGATQFLKNLPKGSVVADVGCGDGKYFPAIWEAGSIVIGTDISLPLLQQTLVQNNNVPESRWVSERRWHLQNKPAVAVADCMSVPLRTNSCDAAICIAVMHHLSTVERRVRCIRELVRIVRVGGTINIQAWAMEQEEGSRRKFAAPDVFVPFNAQPRYLETMALESRDSLVGTMQDSEGKSVAQIYSEAYSGAEFDERKGLVVFKRYCHLYRKGELEELASQIADTCVIESGYESGNYFVILKVVSENRLGSSEE